MYHAFRARCRDVSEVPIGCSESPRHDMCSHTWQLLESRTIWRIPGKRNEDICAIRSAYFVRSLLRKSFFCFFLCPHLQRGKWLNLLHRIKLTPASRWALGSLSGGPPAQQLPFSPRPEYHYTASGSWRTVRDSGLPQGSSGLWGSGKSLRTMIQAQETPQWFRRKAVDE